MNFLKTSIWSGLSTIIKILSGLVVNKIVAIYIGPAGIALIGQFQNILGMITTAGTGAINSGITKYVAEYQDDLRKKNEFLSAGLIITVVCSLLVGVLVFVGSGSLSVTILKSGQYKAIFKVISFTLIFISVNTFLLAVLNGLKKIKSLIMANILGSLLSLMITSILTIHFHLFGALISNVLIQSTVLFVTLFFVYKSKAFNTFQFIFPVNQDVYKKLFSFSLMTLVTMATVPVVQISIRNYLIENLSVKEAGYWQAVWKISELYLMVLTTAFSTYYLPRLSELKSRIELKQEILSGYKIIIPFVLFSSICIYLLRDLIIQLLFTPDFKDMKPLFTFQLIGDFFKMCSWTLSFLMIAKAMTRTFVLTEIFFSISFYLMSIFFINSDGVIGVTYAYALNYLIYLILMIFIFSNIIFCKENGSSG